MMELHFSGHKVETKLRELGLALPPALQIPPAVKMPFAWVRVRGNRAFISGHTAQNSDGSIAAHLGKVGADLSLEQGYKAARLAALSMLGSLKREFGDLDRVVWLRVFGMVNSAAGFQQQSQVINGFSDLILELYGPEQGLHARSAVGVAELPLGIAVEIEAEVEVA